MSWDNVGSNNKSTGKTNYMSLKAGTHKIRILDEAPYTRWTHFLRTANQGKGSSVDCIGKDCPVCEALKENPDLKKVYSNRKLHSLNIIDRATGEHVILEKGDGLLNNIKMIRDNPDFGDPRFYDLQIMVTGTGLSTAFTVIPMAKTPLTVNEEAIEKVDFASREPLTREQIIELMNGASFKDIIKKDNDEVNDAPLDDTLSVDFTK